MQNLFHWKEYVALVDGCFTTLRICMLAGGLNVYIVWVQSQVAKFKVGRLGLRIWSLNL